MLNLSGRVSRVIEREVPASPPWIETTFVIEDWGQTLYVTKAKNFDGELPVEGDNVVLAVSVRAYVKRDGAPGYGLTAHGRQAESADAAPKRVASVG